MFIMFVMQFNIRNIVELEVLGLFPLLGLDLNYYLNILGIIQI
jgi:hypothetical protein